MPLYRLERPYLDQHADWHPRGAILAFDPEGKNAPKPPSTAIAISDEDLARMKKAKSDAEAKTLADLTDPNIDLTKVEGQMALSELADTKKK